MKKLLLTIATVLFLTAPALAEHETTTDNMFTFHAFCNFISQSTAMGDNYEACVANQTELFARFDDTIDYLDAQDRHRTYMEKFYNSLPTDKLTTKGVLNIMYTNRREI